MVVEVLCEAAEAETEVTRDGGRDLGWSGNHCGRMSLMKAECFHEAFAEHRNSLSTFRKWGCVERGLMGGVPNVRTVDGIASEMLDKIEGNEHASNGEIMQTYDCLERKPSDGVEDGG
jgi:hypothetical protein